MKKIITTALHLFALSLLMISPSHAIDRGALIQSVRSGAGLSSGITNAYNIVTVVIGSQGSHVGNGQSSHPSTATQAIAAAIAKIQALKLQFISLR